MKKYLLGALGLSLMLIGFGCGIPSGPIDEDLMKMTVEQKELAMKQMMKNHPQQDLTQAQKDAEVQKERDVVQHGTIQETAELASLAYDGKGSVRIVQMGDTHMLVLSEDFQVDPGPYLSIELSPYVAPHNAAELENPKTIHVGLLKTTIGAQVYLLPKNADLSQIKSVVIYDKPFKLLFAGGAFTP